MKHGRNILLISLLLSLVWAVAGCGPSNSTGPSSSPAASVEIKPSNPDGTVYKAVSENFAFVTYPTKLLVQDGQKCIQFHFEVLNKSDEDYKEFSAAVVINEAMDPYLASGITPLEFKEVNMAATGKEKLETYECRGVNVTLQQFLSTDPDLDVKEVESLAGTFDIRLKWKGGTEEYTFTQPVLNELP